MSDPALDAAKHAFDLLREVPGLHLEANRNSDREEWKGPCPVCGGDNRFAVWPRHPGGPRCACRTCHGIELGSTLDVVGFLMWRDNLSFPDAKRRLGIADAPRRPIAWYNYPDEAGGLLYQVVRTDPKGFFQRRPRTGLTRPPRNDVDTDWEPKLGDVRRVLYHLPEIVLNPEAVVWLVEGEKDANALAALGLLATTNPGGAKSWRPEYTQALAGRAVVFVPDTDKDGAAHRDKVAPDLLAAGCRLKVVALPDGAKDVSDYLAGHTLDDLQDLATATPRYPGPDSAPAPIVAPYTLKTAAELIAMPPPDWLLDGLFETGKLVGMYGFYGGGKSFLALDWALCVATGRAWQGHAVQTGPVVYICPEGAGGMGRRILAWQAANGVDAIPDTFRALPNTVNLLDPDSPGKLLQTLDAYHLTPATLIVIDTLARSMPGGKEDNEFFSVVVEHAGQVQAAVGATVLVVHHAGKNELAGWRGGTGFPAGADTVIGFKNDDGVITLTCEKQKDHEYFPPSRWVLRVVDLGVDAAGKPITSCVLDPAPAGTLDSVLAPRERQLLEALCEPVFEHGATLREMRDATDLANQPIFRAVNALKKRDYVMEIGASKTPGHRWKATRLGYDAVGVIPPWQRVPVRLSESDTDALPLQAGSDTDTPAVSAGGLSASDSPPPPIYARSITEYHGLSGSDTDQHPVTDGSLFHPHNTIGVDERDSVTVSATDNDAPSDPGPEPLPDDGAPVWTAPPLDAPPQPAHVGFCGHSAISVAWNARKDPPGWDCRSCWDQRGPPG